MSSTKKEEVPSEILTLMNDIEEFRNEKVINNRA